MTASRLILALTLLAGLPASARAHGVEYASEVELGTGRASVRFRSAHGERPLAGGWVQVFAPSDAGRPRVEGRTDAAGRFEFAPDAAGTWTVRAVDATGHGAVAKVEVPAVAPAPAPPAAPVPAPVAPARSGRRLSPPARVLAVAVVIVLAFAALAAFHRRRPRE